MIKDTAKECGQMVWLGSQVTITRDVKRKFVKPTPYDTKGGRVLYDMAELAVALWKTDTGRFCEVQKNKINGKRPTARIEVGAGGIFNKLHEWQEPAEYPVAASPYQTTTRSFSPRDYQDA
jgi:hypothetical protein